MEFRLVRFGWNDIWLSNYVGFGFHQRLIICDGWVYLDFTKHEPWLVWRPPSSRVCPLPFTTHSHGGKLYKPSPSVEGEAKGERGRERERKRERLGPSHHKTLGFRTSGACKISVPRRPWGFQHFCHLPLTLLNVGDTKVRELGVFLALTFRNNSTKVSAFPYAIGLLYWFPWLRGLSYTVGSR